MIAAITDPHNVILALSTIAAFMTVMALAAPFLKRDNLASRLEAVTKRREELSLQARASNEPSQRVRRVAANRVNLMKAVLDRLNLDAVLGSKDLRIKMSQAGWRGQAPVITFVFMRLALPIVFSLVAAIFVFGSQNLELEFPVKMLICAGAGGIGMYIPNIIVQNMIQKRQSEMIKGFPDALDIMVICVEAGLSIEAAFGRVAEEISTSCPQLGEEFGLTTAELAFLGDRRQSLENFSERTGMEASKSLSTTLIQSEKYGTPLGVSLRVLSRENRDARMTRAEEKAAKLPATLTVPMIVFFLPVLFMILLGPAIIQVLHTV